MDMEKRKDLIAAVALAAALAAGLASCGGDDAPSGPGLDYGDKTVSAYRIAYTVQLADPAVRDVADVLVEYLDADGTMKKDTLDGGAWTKTVAFAPGKERNYGLLARYSPREDALATKDAYDFAVSLSAPLYILYTNGSSMLWATLRNHTYKGILAPNKDGDFSTRRTADYLLTTYGQEEMDTTATYFNITYRELASGKDTLIYNSMEW